MDKICSQYQKYHSNSGTEITQESLVNQAREFLTTVRPVERFMFLSSDFYRNVLGKISQNFESDEQSIQKIMTGFNSLEKYGVNLWKFPWRKEYHSIKLYTAFFKYNIEQQLQDTEVTFDILQSLGYTVKQQQEVSIKEPDRERAIWMAFNLFLVQVDLQVIKEIMDHFPNGEFTLKEIVRARSKTTDVEDAVKYLATKAAKRRKLDEPQVGDALSHGHTKDTHIGRIDSHTFNNLQPDIRRSGEVTSADQDKRRPAKFSVLSKGRDDVAADTDDSSTGSVLTTRHPSVGSRTEYKVPSGITGVRHFTSISTEQLGNVTDHELYGLSPEGNQLYDASQHNLNPRYNTAPPAGSDGRYNTAPPAGSDARYSTAPPADAKVNARYSTVPQARPSQYPDNTHRYHTAPQVGHPHNYNTKDRMDAPTTTSLSLSHHGTVPPMHSIHQYTNPGYGRFVGDDPGRYGVATQSGTVGVIADAYGYQSKTSARTETQVHGTPSGDARYANLQDINGSAHQQFGSNNLDTSVSSRDSARRHDHRDARSGETRGSGTEPMEVKQIESSHGHRGDAFSRYNGMAEAAYARATGHSGVTELHATMKRQLSIQPGDGLSGKASEQLSSAPTEHRRQYGSESTASAPEAARSRDGTTREAQSSRSLYQNGSNFPSTKEVGQKARSSAADSTSRTAKKIDAQGSSPISSRKASAQGDRGKHPAHSLKNNLDIETSQEGKALETLVKDDASICDLCRIRGTHICRNCFRIVCSKCKEIYFTDLCDSTKGPHEFVKLKSKILQEKSPDSRASSSQVYANVNEGFGDEEKDWSCSRCTYLNPPDHDVCVICAASRGVGSVEEARPGSRVCRNCTLNNEEGTKVCVACHKTLCNSETVV